MTLRERHVVIISVSSLRLFGGWIYPSERNLERKLLICCLLRIANKNINKHLYLLSTADSTAAFKNGKQTLSIADFGEIFKIYLLSTVDSYSNLHNWVILVYVTPSISLYLYSLRSFEHIQNYFSHQKISSKGLKDNLKGKNKKQNKTKQNKNKNKNKTKKKKPKK